MSSKAKPLSESQFNKWRTLIALCHVDGQCCKLEQSFIRERLSKRDVSDEQMKIFDSDFAQAQPAELFFHQIHEPKDRGMLFYLARLIFFQDGEFCDLEKMYYEKFHGKHMETLDMMEIRKQIRDVELELTQPEMTEPSHRSIIMRLLDRFF
jgi:hypothetical protein